MSQHYLIIGSGLIGRLTAWRLLLRGDTVDILSSDDSAGTDSAGFVAAAMVSPATEAISAEPRVKTLGLRSYALWPRWLEDLPEIVFYRDWGTLVVAHSGDEAEMQRFQRRAEHVLQPNDFALLDRAELAQREPALAENFSGAMLFQQEACLDNRQFYRHVGEVLKAYCRWRKCEPIGTLTEAGIDALCQQHFGHGRDRFDAVIDCRGNGAAADLPGLRSVRGEVIRVHAPEVSLQHSVRLMHPRYPFYLAPRPNNEYVLGATVIESDDRSPVSVRSGLELMSALYSLHRGFGEARILEMAAHCRPGMPDNLPTIRRTGWGYHINGFYRHGYLFGPAVVSDMLAMLDDRQDQVMFGELYEI